MNTKKEQFKQQTELMGIGRKIKRGMCWYPLNVGRSYYNALNQLVVEVERREDKEIEHCLSTDVPSVFFTQELSGKLNYLNFTATVNYVDEDRMVVILPNADAPLALQSKEVLGVQLYFDETSYRLMFEALKQVIAAKNNKAGRAARYIPRLTACFLFFFPAHALPVAEPHAGRSRE